MLSRVDRGDLLRKMNANQDLSACREYLPYLPQPVVASRVLMLMPMLWRLPRLPRKALTAQPQCRITDATLCHSHIVVEQKIELDHIKRYSEECSPPL